MTRAPLHQLGDQSDDQGDENDGDLCDPDANDPSSVGAGVADPLPLPSVGPAALTWRWGLIGDHLATDRQLHLQDQGNDHHEPDDLQGMFGRAVHRGLALQAWSIDELWTFPFR